MMCKSSVCIYMALYMAEPILMNLMTYYPYFCLLKSLNKIMSSLLRSRDLPFLSWLVGLYKFVNENNNINLSILNFKILMLGHLVAHFISMW